MRKFELFFNNIATVKSLLKGELAKQVKLSLGDSIKNKRTLTVQQTIRYLENNNQKNLGNQLRKVSKVLEHSMYANRTFIRHTKRTDAFDLTEFVNTYRMFVMDNKSYRNQVSKALKKD